MSEEEKQLDSEPTPVSASQVAAEDDGTEAISEVDTMEAANKSEAGVVDLEALEVTEGSGAEVHETAADADGTNQEPTVTEDVVAGEPTKTEAVDAAALEQLAAEAELMRGQLEERTQQYMRIAADFDNFRKRTAKEKQDLEQRVKRTTLSELLPVIDSFERARSQINPQTDQEDSIQKSYQSVFKQLVDCLKRIGVSPMRAKGTEFNPECHEAVMREPTDQYEEGIVIEELVKGYLLGEQVLRHAMVKVAAPPEPVVLSEESHPDHTESASGD